MNIIKITKPDKKKYSSQSNIIRKSVHKDIDYEKIIIASDMDPDGAHIMGISLGTFLRFGENLFNENKIGRLKTPAVILKDKKEKIVHYFFSMIDFQEWEKNNANWTKLFTLKYIKGLGSWKKCELQQILTENNIEEFIEYFNINSKSRELINSWLMGNSADKRKELLKQFKLDINSI
jgi:DNA gyrase/topoisomerase IV subunit B